MFTRSTCEALTHLRRGTRRHAHAASFRESDGGIVFDREKEGVVEAGAGVFKVEALEERGDEVCDRGEGKDASDAPARAFAERREDKVLAVEDALRLLEVALRRVRLGRKRLSAAHKAVLRAQPPLRRDEPLEREAVGVVRERRLPELVAAAHGEGAEEDDVALRDFVPGRKLVVSGGDAREEVDRGVEADALAHATPDEGERGALRHVLVLREAAERVRLRLRAALELGVAREVVERREHGARLGPVPGSHDVVHVAPQLVVAHRAAVLVAREQERLEQVVGEPLLAPLNRLAPRVHHLHAERLHPPVTVRELPNTQDVARERVQKLYERERRDVHLPHNLRGLVVPLQELVLARRREVRRPRLELLLQLPGLLLNLLKVVAERNLANYVQRQRLRRPVHIHLDAVLSASLRSFLPHAAELERALGDDAHVSPHEVLVEERPASHLPVLPVVLSVGAGEAHVPDDVPEAVRQHPRAIRAARSERDVLEHGRIERRHAVRPHRVADGERLPALRPLQHGIGDAGR
mmetsp:Transcript_17010/g.55650  ORF Transcript_17010/g.55650 Transcript_17010/m.55650 type:complete len:525 (+) Transcript_17010:28-1602(+)